MKRYHVTPKDDQWQVKGERADRAVSVHDNKEDAIKAGREVAQNANGQLIVHRQDGVFQTEWTYGPDPEKSPG